jgi:hypothetical protein
VLIEKLVERYPYTYHMAEANTWTSIRRRGLLSATAALDALKVSGARRTQLESDHRPEMLSLHPGHADDIVLRDQRPMPPGRLRHALPPDLSPKEWYQLISNTVFFWVSKERLGRLLRSYGTEEHDVLEVDTASLVGSHADRTWLCHMNSGNTWPIPHRRDTSIFKRIPDYPVNRSGRPTKEVVELVIDYSVPDITSHVVNVTRMRGDEVLGTVWRR